MSQSQTSNPPTSSGPGPQSATTSRVQGRKRSIQLVSNDSIELCNAVGYQSKVRVLDRYQIVGFISSGTYGRVYKAKGRQGQLGDFAIKKFKPGIKTHCSEF